MLLLGGWHWSATSPLLYTLQRNAQYAHFGYTKTFRYIGQPKVKEDVYNSEKRIAEDSLIYKKVCDGTWENWKSWDESTHRMNTTQDLEPLHDFPIEHFTQLVKGDPTVSKYLDFYHALHDHVISKGYKSVGDGYSGYRITNDFRGDFDELLSGIKSEFEVKVLFIVRDPIRRGFSHFLNRLHAAHLRKSELDSSFTTPVKQWVKEGFGSKKRDLGKIYEAEFACLDYVGGIKKMISDFGKDNVHVMSMEELWEDDGTSKRELSQFLDHPIDHLWKNLYAPDRGHLVEFDRDVPCQAFAQDLYELTPDMYYEYKKKYQHIYDSWKEMFGSLPLYWGEPIKYE